MAFLARRHGLQAVIAARAEFRHAHQPLARLAGACVAELRQQWLETL